MSIRLKKLGFTTKLYNNLKVFHKRRISVSGFLSQVYRFGVARSILNNRYPETRKIIYWFPVFFSFFFLISAILYLFNINNLIFILFMSYLTFVLIQSSLKHNIFVGFLSVITTLIQFMGYGYGFIKSLILIHVFRNKKIETIFPKMFFN